MKSPYNPKVLLWNNDGRPSPRSKIFFFSRDTDIPKSVKYVEGGTLTNEITADSSGDFPQVELLEGDYTLRGYTPLDPKEPYPEFPLDYELRDTWDLSGEAIQGEDVTEAQVQVGSLQALREYNGDAEKVWVGNRLFIKDEYVSQTDNNGTIVVSTALTGVVWRMDLTGYDTTSLDWFGADKSGTDDSTAAFIAAISAIYANDAYSAPYKLPRKLYIPEGTYKINSDINFTCPVYMETSVRFGNTSVLPITMTFSSGLETAKGNAFDLGLPGLSPINLRFPNGGNVRLAWFNNSEINMDDHGSKINIIGPGKITVSGGNTRRIGTLTPGGITTIEGSSGTTIIIDKIDLQYPNNLRINGPVTVKVPVFDLSWLEDPLNITKVTGNTLYIDRDWDIPSGFNSNWSRVEGKLVNGAKPVLKNTSGNTGYIGFPNADVEWDSLDCSAHDLVWTNGPVAKYLNWNGTDGSDWTAQLAYSLADFEGTSTSGDINLTSDATLENLNHTGTMMAFGHSLVINSCKINLTSGKEVRGSALTISDSSILTDDPANGQIVSSNMRLRNSLITCPVNLYGADNMQLEMRGCRFTNQVSVSSSYTLQTLVATHNEVGLCNFIPYTIYCHGLSDAAKVSIDISENWTTDLTGQLVHSKGFAKTKPHWNGDQHFYFQPYEAIGILDIRNNTVENSPSLAANSRIHAYFVSGGDDDYQPIVNTYTNFAGAIKLDGVSSLSERRNITFDAWNTQAYEE